LAGCESLEKLAADKGVKTVRLAVAGAFHTEIMKPADERLKEALDQVAMSSPRIPVWSNVDAKPHTDPVEIKRLLVQQVLMPVRWEDQMRAWHAEQIDRWYEIGPARVLAGLLKRVDRKAECVNVTA
jgi:[acyl-carrier-protein] S-malonyltransferase